ncbi:MAG: 50S ribosomal protein L24 [Actinobacteria bacterium]|jgi:large subunit ribosomal protein L24|nr:MAG: 50S ribosomal protein L24 [Actinomycetota bacterium]
MARKMKLVKGDQVEVLSGKDLGKRGVITRVLPETRQVIIDGVNVSKKHQRPTRATMQGGIIDKDMPIDMSNVALVCPKDGPTRINYEIADDGTKTRVCAKCGGLV